MPSGMLTDQIHDGSLRFSGVVEICPAVREARSEMQKGYRWRALHAAVTVGGACRHPFEQAQNRPNAGLALKGRD